MNFKLISALAVGLLSATSAFSGPITLDFEGATSFASVADYYNGGTDGAGASFDANFGVSFAGDALALSNDGTGSGANGEFFTHAPSAGTVLAPVGADAALNRSVGFINTASFYYSSSQVASVSLFSGLNGTGTLLGSFNLLANATLGCSDSAFCHWDLASLAFNGVAQSIQFGSAAGVAGFDNVTITPVPVPAAIWLMLSGLSGLGVWSRRKSSTALNA